MHLFGACTRRKCHKADCGIVLTLTLFTQALLELVTLKCDYLR